MTLEEIANYDSIGQSNTSSMTPSTSSSQKHRRESIKILHRASVASTIDRSRRSRGRMSFAGVANKKRSSVASAVRPTPKRLSITTISEVIDGAVGVTNKGLSTPLAAALTINLIPIGYLSLPYAFSRAGTLLSLIGFALVMLLAFVTAGYVLEACARFGALANLADNLEAKLEAEEKQFEQEQGSLHVSEVKDTIMDMEGKLLELIDRKDFVSALGEDEFETNPGDADPATGCRQRKSTKILSNLLLELSHDNKTEDGSETDESKKNRVSELYPHPVENSLGAHKVTDLKAEFPELCRMFLGNRMKLFFILTLALDLYGVTWGYASIFGGGLADMLPIVESSSSGTDMSYVIYIIIFAAIVTPLSCMDLSDQVLLQLAFLVVRMVMVTMMIGTVAAAWTSGESHFDDYIGPASASIGGGMPLFHFQSLFLLLGTSIFSCSFQFAVPGVTDAVADKDTVQRKIFGSTCLFVFVTVLMCSLVLSTYFGSQMQTSSNLNWVLYHGGTGDVTVNDDGTITRTNIALWARGISGFITIFPAIDALAVFPLCSISLGEILMNGYYGSILPTDVAEDWKRRLAFRLLGTCPQLVGAALVSDLSVIANYAGIFTILSYLVCPSLLLIFSGKALRQVGIPDDTHYKTVFSRDWIAWINLLLMLGLIGWIVISAVLMQ